MRNIGCAGLGDGVLPLHSRYLPCIDATQFMQPGRLPPPHHRMASSTGMGGAQFCRHPLLHSPPAQHVRGRSKRAHSPACSCSAAVGPTCGYRVRRAVVADVPAVAELLKEVGYPESSPRWRSGSISTMSLHLRHSVPVGLGGYYRDVSQFAAHGIIACCCGWTK